MSTPFDVRRWAEQAGIQTTGGFAVVAECVTLDELQRFADIAIATAAKHWQRAHAIAALAEPVQEPVAWIHIDPDKPRVKFLEWQEDEPGYRGRWIKTPLYTAPPQRKPLTEEEIDKIVAAHVRITDQNLSGAVYMAMRDLEAAHGIGEKE